MGGEFPQHIESKSRFTAEPISCLDISHRNPWKPVEPRMPFHIALDYMIAWRAIRIPVVDGEGEFVSLVTQSTVLNALSSHLTTLSPDIVSQTVASLHLPLTPVSSVKLTDKAIEAFKIMNKEHYSAVAVVNEAGALVGNISASDLKAIGYDAKMFNKLFMTVEEFLKLIQAGREGGGKMLTVNNESKVEEAIEKMVQGKVHRLYVVEKGTDKPVGVLTQLDIIKAVRTQQKALATSGGHHGHEHSKSETAGIHSSGSGHHGASTSSSSAKPAASSATGIHASGSGHHEHTKSEAPKNH